MRPTPEQRFQQAVQLADQAGWRSQLIKTSGFSLRTFSPVHAKPNQQLVVYLEGDGFAWRNRYQPSLDPSPINPVGLKLALQHAGSNAVYLARPCQYVAETNRQLCQQSGWTSGRFAEAVIAATNEAVSQLKARYQAQQLTLVGFSGGGAVATLVAARRDDVNKLVTVAGNLDHKFWTRLHQVTPLNNSLNPADYWQAIDSINQHHFIGEKDDIVPESVAESFVKKFTNKKSISLHLIKGFDHHCCWESDWKKLWIKTN